MAGGGFASHGGAGEVTEESARLGEPVPGAAALSTSGMGERTFFAGSFRYAPKPC